MKRLFTLMAVAGMAMTVNAQSITISSVDQTLAGDYAGGLEIDLNNDGIKELLFSGKPNSDVAGKTTLVDADGNEYEVDGKTWVLKWNGSSYDKQEIGTSADRIFGIRNTVIPADFNGDGLTDLFIAGEGYNFPGVYLMNENGAFVKDPNYAVLDNDNNEVFWRPRSADVADFNSDGLPDIVTIGWSSDDWKYTGPNRQSGCGVLINQGNGQFKNVIETGVIGNGDVDFDFALCTVRAYDLNNDGKPDILLQGNVDNDGVKPSTVNGTQVGRTFMAFGNITEDGEVGFFDMELATSVSHTFGNGNINVADFNNDGTPDIFVTGESPDDAVTGWAYYPQLLMGKISNGEVGYTDNTSFVARGKDVRPLNSTNVGVRSIDYNGDGFYDLFYPGWCEQMLDGSGNTQSGWFLPGSAAGLTSYQRIPGASEQGIFFLDYGVEGALNYTFTGYHGDATYFADETDKPMGRSMVFTKNPWNVAARPDAPTAPAAEVDGNSVKLSWTPAASSMKNVTYEYYLKNKATGKIYNGATSFIGGDKDGVRKVLREGNAFMNTELNLTLPEGTYEWGVQTINAALRGSVFAKGQDLVVGDGNNIRNMTETAVQTGVYSADGKQLSGMQKGINIVKMSDGNVKKVVK